ncbi:MAG: tripartite tricarboxylate transporter substrate binding protein [Methylobacteriaceae bacterium]|jgi:tripartite-type tricarboxylate transporter receptor subunit TctC|nr:tripartite tricarboxylate transporter substrate binding protein [Methylobacteriaceae bacterium]
MKLHRLLTFAASAGLALALSQAATAADYPTKSIELICSMSAGGDSDFNAREIAKYLTQELGQSVVVTNITGGGSAVATDEFIHSPNDGYRLYMNHSSLHSATAFGISEYAWYDMEPIDIFGRGTGEVIVVASDFPATDVKGLIEEAKKNPGKYRFGYNAGATSHYLAVSLANEGAVFNNVSTGSAADRVVGLKGGHLDVIVAGIPNIIDYVKTGEFKILGNCASMRSPFYPDISTLIEQGYNISFDPTYVLYAVKGTDPAIIAKLDAAVKKIVSENKEYAAEIEKAFQQSPYYEDTAKTKETLKVQLDKFMAVKDQLRAGFSKK